MFFFCKFRCLKLFIGTCNSFLNLLNFYQIFPLKKKKVWKVSMVARFGPWVFLVFLLLLFFYSFFKFIIIILTGFYEIINFEFSKGQIFRIQSTFGNPPKFLILVTNLKDSVTPQSCVKVAICPKSPSLTVNKI